MADDKSQLVVEIKSTGIDSTAMSLESLAVSGSKAEAGALAAKEAMAGLSTQTEGLSKSATNWMLKQQAQNDLFGQSAEYGNAYTATMKGMTDAQVALAGSLGAQIDLQKASATANKDLAASTLDVAKANAVLAETEEAQSVRLRAVAEAAVARQAAQRLEQTEERERILAKDAERSKMSSAGAAGSGYATAHAMTPSITRDEAAVAKAAEDAEKLAIEQEAMASTADKLLAKYDPLNYKLAQNAAMIDQVTNKTAALNWTEQQTKDVLAGLNMEKVSLELKKTEQAATAAGKGMEGFSMGSAKAKTEFVTLIREIMRGDFSRIPGTLSILTAQTGMMGVAMTVALSPVTYLVAEFGALAIAAAVGQREMSEFDKTMIMTGNIAAMTSSQFASVTKELGNIGSEGQHAAANALTEISKDGVFTASQLKTVGKAAIEMQEATGQAVQQTAKEFEKLAGDPVKASLELNDKYHYLTVSVYEQIRALEDQGDHLGAVNAAIHAAADAIDQRTPQELENIGYIEKGWDAAKKAVVGYWNATLNVGRNDPTSQIKALQDQIDRNNRNSGFIGLFGNPQTKTDEVNKGLQQQIDDLKKHQQAAEIVTLVNSTTAEADSLAVKSANQSRNRLDNLNKENKLLLEQNKIKADFINMENASGPKSDQLKGVSFGADGNTPSGGAYDTEMADAKNRIMGKGRTPRTNDNGLRDQIAQQKILYAQEEQDLAQNLKDIKNLYDIGESDQKTFLEDTLEAKDDALGKEYNIVAKEYEIAKGEKNIAAKEAYAKEMQTILNKMVNNSQQFENDMAKVDANALKSSEVFSGKLVKDVEQRQDEIDAALSSAKGVSAVGNQNSELLKLQKDFDSRMAALTAEYEGGKIDEATFSSRIKENQDFYDTRLDQERDFQTQMKTIDDDWVTGYKKALSTYASSSNNAAIQSQQVFTNAFDSMGNALATFATTGKLNFTGLVTSILADLAKMEAKAATSSVLKMLLESYGGSNNSASNLTQSAPASTQVYSQAGGYSAKGNVFDEGQYHAFATGGAFTNGVVSGPTNFNMGLMGEAGPEAIVPLTRTSDGSLGVKQTGGSGGSSGDVNANTVINIASSGTATSGTSAGANASTTQKQFAAAISAATQAEISKQMRQGGLLWKMRNGQTGT